MQRRGLKMYVSTQRPQSRLDTPIYRTHRSKATVDKKQHNKHTNKLRKNTRKEMKKQTKTK